MKSLHCVEHRGKIEGVVKLMAWRLFGVNDAAVNLESVADEGDDRYTTAERGENGSNFCWGILFRSHFFPIYKKHPARFIYSFLEMDSSLANLGIQLASQNTWRMGIRRNNDPLFQTGDPNSPQHVYRWTTCSYFTSSR